MSEQQSCSLCCITGSEYISLQNGLDEWNETYDITVKYFDPILLTENESTCSNNNNLVLCEDCWFHIDEFHEFQQNILITRRLWKDKAQLQTLLIEIKQEEIQEIVQTSSITDTESLDRKNNEDLKKAPKPIINHAVENKKGNIFDLDEEKKEYNCLKLTNKGKRGKKPKSIKNKTSISGKIRVKLTKEKKPKVIRQINKNKAKKFDAIIAEWKSELSCDLCSETSPNFEELGTHFKEKHQTNAYVKCCERKFDHRYVLVNHIQYHLNPDAHKCDICGKSCKTKEILKGHKSVVHENTKELKCDFCDKLFKQKNTLNRHMLTHSTSTDFVCSDCGKGYPSAQILKNHVKLVHNSDRVCDQCGKHIHGIQAFRLHLMDHAGIERRKFPCDICGLKLMAASSLRNHKSIYHSDGSSIYVCSVCGKVAQSENALRNHKRLVHTIERKYKCTYCGKAFKQKNFLRDHMASHVNDKPYQCPHCPRKFKVNSRMYRHRKIKHPAEYEEARKNYRKYPKINNNPDKTQIVIC